MKLSAPPPPPPEPPEPNQPPPGDNVPGNAENAANAPPPTDANSPLPAAKALTWPAWFAGADFLLAALAIVLAFLLASFVARNTDLWLHLAAGKRLFSGEYTPGSDPFSYSAADRAWVNHSWLFDAGAYLLYGGKGTVLVAVKALAVAVAFGLLIAIRRPGYSLWPWAAFAAVAAIAAGPRLILGPLVGSMFLLAVMLYLLFKVPHRPGSWRFPIAIGVLFWFWANVDQWFFIGPLTLALVLIGELVQRKLWGESDDSAATEPLGRLPDVPTLARALGIGIVACMLNPHHVRVWDLPFELVGASGISGDFRLRQVLYMPLHADFFSSSANGRALGYNVNGLAYAVLIVVGGIALGITPFILALVQGSPVAFGTEGGKAIGERTPTAYFFLWGGFFALSLCTIYAIPFFALVAVPIIAGQLNAISTRMTLKSWGDPKSRFLLLGSAGGRVICVLAVVVACVLAWPGWMHPDIGNPAFARRVGWEVQPDEALVKASQQLQAWRADGRLPDDVRGVVASVDLANYIAWFAPREKVFVNGRYSHHRRELPDFVEVRAGVGLIQQDQLSDFKRLTAVLDRLGAEYVVVSGTQTDRGTTRLATRLMWIDADRWSPWYLDGRTTISGWRSTPGTERPTFAALRVDPIALAFGKGVERVPRGETKPPPPNLGWEDEFLRGASVPPEEADEALGWVHYGEIRRTLMQARFDRVDLLFAFVDQLTGGGGKVSIPAVYAIRAATPDSELGAIPILAMRAARRAIAAAPDHPDGYYALSQALADPGLRMSSEERGVARVIALQQYLTRLPPPERYEHYRRGSFIALPSDAAQTLAFHYLGQQVQQRFIGMPANLPALQILGSVGATSYLVESGKQLLRVPAPMLRQVPNGRIVGGPYLLAIDLAHEALLLAEKYMMVEGGDPQRLEQLRALIKVVEAQHKAADNAFEQMKDRARLGGTPKLYDQFRMALQQGLVGEALRILTDPGTDLQKEFERDALQIALTRIALELAVGRIEVASGDIKDLEAQFDELGVRPDVRQRLGVDNLRPTLRTLAYQKAIFEGDYAGAGAMLDSDRAAIGGIGEDPAPTPEQARVNPLPLSKGGEALLPALPLLPHLPVFPSLPSVVLPAMELADKQWLIVQLLSPYILRQQVLNNRRTSDSEFYWRRGFLFLLEGDIAEARKRFKESRQKGIPEWGVPDRVNADAQRYLRLIEQVEK